MKLHIETPLLPSLPLGRTSGRDVWLKMEALQPSGSFKLRGIGFACETYARRGATRFISSSGGNAGLAAACAGRALSIPVVVVVPETASARALELLAMEGAQVIVHGASWSEANGHALSLVGPTDAFLHPFDDPLLWQGHATMIDEIVASGLSPDAVLLSVGGGGLLCGVAEGMRRNGMDRVPIVAVETRGAASYHASLEAGGTVELDRIESVATSLGAKRVCERIRGGALRVLGVDPVRSLVVSDASAVAACRRFLDDHRILVEPACGASLAPLYEGAEELGEYGTVLVVVCGGATTTVDRLAEWSAGPAPS